MKQSTKHRVARTRADGNWTEARYFSFIRSALRRASSKWPVKFSVKLAARRKKPLHSAGKHRYEYCCAICNGYFPDKDVAVDHIKPAGSLKSYDDLPRFVELLFCEADNLQVVCHPCHAVKTTKERKEREK